MQKDKNITQGIQAYWIMSTPVHTVQMGDTLKDVAGLFSEKNISAAAVLDKQRKPTGVITKTDLIRHDHVRDQTAIFNKRPSALVDDGDNRSGFQIEDEEETVEHWMTPVIFSVKPETPIEEVARLMVKYGVHHIFVKGKNGDPMVGIVSSFDILKRVATPEADPHAANF